MELSSSTVGGGLEASPSRPVLQNLPTRARAKKLNGNPHYFCATHALQTETVHWRRATSRESSLQALVARVLGVRGCHEREVVLVDVTVLSV